MKVKDIILSLRSFSPTTIIIAVVLSVMLFVPCFIKIPAIAPAPIGSGLYFPGTFFSDMKNILLLLVALLFFKEADNNAFIQSISPKWLDGFIYGVYLMFTYVSISWLRQFIFLLGLSFGMMGWGYAYYLTVIILFYTFLRKYYSPMKALSAAMFTAYAGVIVWELPHYFMFISVWNQERIFRTVARFITFGITFYGYIAFKTKIKSLKYYLPLFGAIMLLAVFSGRPVMVEGDHIIKFHVISMATRILTQLGLFYIFWVEGLNSYIKGEKRDIMDKSRSKYLLLFMMMSLIIFSAIIMLGTYYGVIPK